MRRVAVIGGGISGLACAYDLKQAVTGLRVDLFESGPELGGAIQTRRTDGYVIEQGPTGFINRNTSTLDLVDRLGLTDELIAGDGTHRRRYVLADGALRTFPTSAAEFLKSDLLTWGGKLRVLAEPFIARSKNQRDESVAEFVRRRFGSEALDLLVSPFVSGVYAGETERLSVRATLPELKGLELRDKSIMWSLWKRGQRKSTAVSDSDASNQTTYVSFRQGLSVLVDALRDALGDSIHVNAPVRALTRVEHGWSLQTDSGDSTAVYDAVVSAVSADVTGRLLGQWAPAILGHCEEVEHAPVAMVALGYRASDVAHPLDGFGYLLSAREPGDVLGVLWNSSIYPGHRAPEGHVLLQVIVGGARDYGVRTRSEEDVIHAAKRHLKSVLGIGVEPAHQAYFLHSRGLPQYAVGHKDRLERARAAFTALSGVYVIGNGFDGIGINSCTAAAQTAATDVIAYLSECTRPTADLRAERIGGEGSPQVKQVASAS